MIGGGINVKDSVSKESKAAAIDNGAAPDDPLDQIREALRGLKFGSVNIIVQDGVVIQIDRTEKRRLRANRNDI